MLLGEPHDETSGNEIRLFVSIRLFHFSKEYHEVTTLAAPEPLYQAGYQEAISCVPSCVVSDLRLMAHTNIVSAISQSLTASLQRGERATRSISGHEATSGKCRR
jgi:hypothetical protein